MNINKFCITPMSEIAFGQWQSVKNIGFKKWMTKIPNCICNSGKIKNEKTANILNITILFKVKYLHFKLSACCVWAYQLDLRYVLFPPEWFFQFRSVRCHEVVATTQKKQTNKQNTNKCSIFSVFCVSFAMHFDIYKN